jgi:CHAT domain-containing protein
MRLIDICDVSYAPTLSLLTADVPATARADEAVTVLLDTASTRFLPSAVDAISQEWGGAIRLHADPTEPEALRTTRDTASADLLFACHGVFHPQDPGASRLEIGGSGGLSLSTLLAEAALPGLRSVTMAACASGQIRAEIVSESIGLSGVLLAAGVRHVIGSLWDVNELATALLLTKQFGGLRDGLEPAAALNAAQRDLRQMSAAEVAGWIRKHVPEGERFARQVTVGQDTPFAAPFYWAGFMATGALPA